MNERKSVTRSDSSSQFKYVRIERPLSALRSFADIRIKSLRLGYIGLGPGLVAHPLPVEAPIKIKICIVWVQPDRLAVIRNRKVISVLVFVDRKSTRLNSSKLGISYA